MRTLTWNEVNTSALGFGCASLMGRAGRRDSLRALHAAWDAGIMLFDTARSYGFGESESLLGDFLTGNRDRATIITKFGILPARPSLWKRLAKPIVRDLLSVAPQARPLVRQGIASQASPGHFDIATLRTSLDESLRQLRTDYVDILLAHEPPPSAMAQDDLLAALHAIIRAGKARRIGIACTGHDATLSAAQGPPLLSVLQYPAWQIDHWPTGRSNDRLRIASQLFGGASRAGHIATTLHKLAGNPSIDNDLRAKLIGTPNQLAAAYCFTRARLTSHPHLLLASMIQPKHLHANIAAMADDRFSATDIQQLDAHLSAASIFS